MLCKKYNKHICFSPEYMGESKYQITDWKYMSSTNPRTHDFVIIGGEQPYADKICDIFVEDLGPEKTYYICNSTEAEMIKYLENSFFALKVAYFNEIYDLCDKLGISYHKVREGWALDNRVCKMHTSVFVNKRKFGGKCYPKDCNAF
jgi:UDP-glucose 6-dehydrogenase